MAREASPGEAEHPVAGEIRVPDTVSLEWRPGAMEAVAVQLGDQAVLAPQRVHLVGAHGCVELGRGELGGAQDAAKKALCLGAGGAVVEAIADERPQAPGTGAAAGALDRRQELGLAKQAEDQCLVEGALEIAFGEVGREVDEGAGGAGEGQAVLGAAIGRWQDACAMEADTWL